MVVSVAAVLNNYLNMKKWVVSMRIRYIEINGHLSRALKMECLILVLGFISAGYNIVSHADYNALFGIIIRTILMIIISGLIYEGYLLGGYLLVAIELITAYMAIFVTLIFSLNNHLSIISFLLLIFAYCYFIVIAVFATRGVVKRGGKGACISVSDKRNSSRPTIL